MGILTRPLLHPQQRWDLEDFNLGLSALRTDAHYQIKRFWADASYIIGGFTISQAAIGQPTADVVMTGATLINGNNTGDISWWTAPVGAPPTTLPTGVGGLQFGRNYVELEVYALDGTSLERAFWDPTANSGGGVEFNQEVDTVTEMFVRPVINQTGFSVGNENRIRLAIIDLDGSLNIRGIRDKRFLFNRLGTPDNIDHSFPWGTQVEPPVTLVFTAPSGTAFVAGEQVTFGSGATATVAQGGTNNVQVYSFSTDAIEPGDSVLGATSGATATLQSYYESFNGADKDIATLKDVISALQTQIRSLKGTRFWFEAGNVASVTTLLNYVNTIIAPISVGASFGWTGSAFKITDSKTTLQATSDVVAALRIPGYGGNLYLTREDGTGGSAMIALPDQNVLFIQLPAAGTSRTYSESGPGVTNFQVTPIASFVPSDSNYVLAYREGTKVIVPGMGEMKPGEDIDVSSQISKETLAYIGAPDDATSTPDYTFVPSGDLSNQFSDGDSLTQAISVTAANVNDLASALLKPYEERLSIVVGAPANDNQMTGPVASTSTLTLPTDSRDSDAIKTYLVGKGSLMVWLNGQYQIPGVDYAEIGSPGALSSTFQILRGLIVGDELDIRIITPQYIGIGAANQPFFLNYIMGQNGASIPVGHLYNTGTDRLQIWRNGISLWRSASVGDAVDRYVDENNQSVTLGAAANPTDVFTFVNHVSPSPAVTLITGVSGTVLTVPTYTIGNKALRVYRNGVLLCLNAGAPSDLKYAETSTTSITLTLAATVADVFKIYIGNVPTWRETLTGVALTTLTIPNSRTFTHGDQKMLVFRNGLLLYNSTVLGTAAARYQETGTTQVTLGTASVTSDCFEFIYL